MGNSPIVNRINSLLAERGIDKKKFYDDCGITSASYSLWNTGKTKPRMKNLEIIADYLHVPVSYLLEGKEQKEKPAPKWGGLKEVRCLPVVRVFNLPLSAVLSPQACGQTRRHGKQTPASAPAHGSG